MHGHKLPVLWTVLFVFLLTTSAQAHKVNLYAYVADGTIQGEGYFSSGDKAQDCPVVLRDASGAELGSARTNAQGQFSLPLPPLTPSSAPLRLVLSAGDGHQNDFTLTARDLGRDLASAATPAEAALSATIPVTTTPDTADQASAFQPPAFAPDAPVSAAALEAMLNQALDRKLIPVNAQLAALAERADRVSAKDIVAGLGWILGLFGVACYFTGKRRG